MHETSERSEVRPVHAPTGPAATTSVAPAVTVPVRFVLSVCIGT